MFSCHIHYTSQCAHIVSFTVAFFRRLLSLHASQLLDPHHSVYSAEQQRFADHRAESDQHIKVLRDLSVTVLLIAQLRYQTAFIDCWHRLSLYQISILTNFCSNQITFYPLHVNVVNKYNFILQTMCCACGFVTFWTTKCHTQSYLSVIIPTQRLLQIGWLLPILYNKWISHLVNKSSCYISFRFSIHLHQFRMNYPIASRKVILSGRP